MQSRFFRFFCLAFVIVTLSGCVAGILAGQAIRLGNASYNASSPEKSVNLTLDHMGAVRIRSQLDGVKHIAILAKIEIAMSFVDYWEDAGKQASIITEHGDRTTLSNTQAKVALAAACKRSVDATIYSRTKNTETNRLNVMIGKATTTIEAELFVYSCRLKRLDSSPVTIAFNAMGQTSSEFDRAIGAGIAAKLIEIAG